MSRNMRKNLPKRKNNLDFQRYLPKAPAYFSKIDKKTVEQKTFTPKKKSNKYIYASSHILSSWLGCPITSSAWYLGSITILSFGEPGSLGHQKTTPPIFLVSDPSSFCRVSFNASIFLNRSKMHAILRVDAGQLRESDCIPTEWLSRRPQIWAS